MKTIIEMAREAGVEVTYDPTETPTRAFAECWIEDLERFAGLVRADERDRAMRENAYVLAEREACVKVIESHGPFLANGALLVEAIRARGNT